MASKEILPERELYDVLNAIVSNFVKTGSKDVNAILIPRIMPTKKAWISYENTKEDAVVIHSLLKALSLSGDLDESEKGKYVLNAQAFNTLAKFNLEKQRHEDQVNHNAWIKNLTILITLIALLTLIMA